MASSSTLRRHERNAKLVKAWRDVPTGTPVCVRRANGLLLLSVTNSRAWLATGGGAYVRVRGIPGNTRLDRVSLAEGS